MCLPLRLCLGPVHEEGAAAAAEVHGKRTRLAGHCTRCWQVCRHVLA